jgi:hypothetical protein
MTDDQDSSPRQFAAHLPAIGAAAAGAVFAALLGSFLGTAGTIAGMAIGSLASGTTSWWAERGIQRAHAITRARAEAVRRAGRPLAPHETQIIDADAIAAQEKLDRREGRRRHRHLGAWGVIVLGALAGCILAVTLVEHAAGKPLSYVVQGKHGHGTSLGGSHPASSSPVSPAHETGTPTQRTSTPTPTPSADLTPAQQSTSPSPTTAGPVQSAVSSIVSQAVSQAVSPSGSTP